MAPKCLLLLILFAFFIATVKTTTNCDGLPPGNDDDDEGPVDGSLPDVPTFNRSAFPPGFLFGTASAAYQYEGAYNIDGKGPSIWDNFTANPNNTKDHKNGDVAEDFYHHYKEDIATMKKLGFDAFRFSISWSRILPGGKLSTVNPLGVAFYNNVIDEIIANGMTPFVTIFHFDLPLALEAEYGGFRNDLIVEDFRAYAELCFALYGDRVKHWITINEPWTYSAFGYAYGYFPPARCSTNQTEPLITGVALHRLNNYVPKKCTAGDSGTEPYEVARNLLLAHASAVDTYRKNYKEQQNGEIGITLCVEWKVPLTNQSQDIDAAARGLAFMYGWFMEPLHSGNWPPEMVSHVHGSRLRNFSESEKQMLVRSFDFIGVNYYSSSYAYAINCSTQPNYVTDACVNTTPERDGKKIGQEGASDWLYSYPPGFRAVLNFTKEQFNVSKIFVTENGFDGREGYKLDDWLRKNYHRGHLHSLNAAVMEDKINIGGYFAWSFLDTFEWNDAFTIRFGMVYVNYTDTNLTRTCKKTAYWFQKFLNVTS